MIIKHWDTYNELNIHEAIRIDNLHRILRIECHETLLIYSTIHISCDTDRVQFVTFYIKFFNHCHLYDQKITNCLIMFELLHSVMGK